MDAEMLGILAVPLGILVLAAILGIMEGRMAPSRTLETCLLYRIGLWGRWSLVVMALLLFPFADGMKPGHFLYPLGNNPGDWVMAAIGAGMAFFAAFGCSAIGLVLSWRAAKTSACFMPSPAFRFASASLAALALGILVLAMIIVGMLQNVPGIK